MTDKMEFGGRSQLKDGRYEFDFARRYRPMSDEALVGWLVEQLTGAQWWDSKLFWAACDMFQFVEKDDVGRLRAIEMLREAGEATGLLQQHPSQFERSLAGAEQLVEDKGISREIDPAVVKALRQGGSVPEYNATIRAREAAQWKLGDSLLERYGPPREILADDLEGEAVNCEYVRGCWQTAFEFPPEARTDANRMARRPRLAIAHSKLLARIEAGGGHE
jgi:hypothetical protein